MNLRLILFVLAALAFLSATIGGSLYYSSLREAAFKDAEQNAVARLEMIKINLQAFLSKNVKPAKTLSGMSSLRSALLDRSADSLKTANRMLDHFKSSLDVDVCYLMDPEGLTIASSNRNDPDSFVGQNFRFRPYFKEAIRGTPFTYLALGTTSGKRGAYHSHPIYGKNTEQPIGIVVIKVSIEEIEKALGPEKEEIVLVTDSLGVIFISNRKEWLYHLFYPLSDEEISRIESSLQFGKGPWKWIGLREKDTGYVVDPAEKEYLLHTSALANFSGWRLMALSSRRNIAQKVSQPLISITGPIVLSLCVLIGLSVFLLYRKASNEIGQRKAFEKALQESEERYRSIYHNTPAMLHSIDRAGRLVSVSDYWADALGYRRDEVIGRKLIDFFTDTARQYAEEIVLPEFFKTGFCKDIPYQFVTKEGDVRDILLSAIGDRDEAGNVVRSLAISVDVTERKRAEKALQRAKEALSQYSKDLERQVLKRTREITSILKYTPAVVYIKDNDGRYLLVNSRYEELFHVENEAVRGKTDYDILSKTVADQIRANDLKVLSENRPYQVEEHLPQEDGIHTYLSVKFPIYDESGATSGVCGILTDITALKKAEEQLRRLSGSIMANQEKERSAIARELHDELGQVLTALRMDAVWMLDRIKQKDPKAALRALTMCELIDQTIQGVRSMAFRLRPGVLDDLGLVDALDLYTTDFERRTGITCVFEPINVPTVGDTVATAAYRIAQEALTNAVRHAEASHIEVRVEAQNGNLLLTVSDDGRGFNTNDLPEFEGFGLAGMKERAGLAGGVLEIRSSPGSGTRIVCRIPIQEHRREAV